MLRVLGRHAWRPAHLHMIVQAPGHKPLITEFFPDDDKYLEQDAVFGVRNGLVLPFKRAADRSSLPANLAIRDKLPMPVWTATLDLTLPPA
jgi:protocatechuate 3,4-dioxygenase beta subunit